jgi:hypothetical protein
MISYLPTILSFWSCALASKTYNYLPIYLGRYLHNTCQRKTRIQACSEWQPKRWVNVTPRFYKKRKWNFFDFHVTLLTHQSYKLAAEYNFSLIMTHQSWLNNVGQILIFILLASARIVLLYNIMQVRGRSHKELCCEN